MVMVRKLVAIGLLAVSLVVAAHFVLTPFYEDTMDVGRMWNVLNWFMAAAAIVALAVNYHRYHVMDGRAGEGPITREYLKVNAALLASILLVLWFLWNWFDNLTVGSGGQSDLRLILWAFIDPLFVLVTGATGLHIWRSASAE